MPQEDRLVGPVDDGDIAGLHQGRLVRVAVGGNLYLPPLQPDDCGDFVRGFGAQFLRQVPVQAIDLLLLDIHRDDLPLVAGSGRLSAGDRPGKVLVHLRLKGLEVVRPHNGADAEVTPGGHGDDADHGPGQNLPLLRRFHQTLSGLLSLAPADGSGPADTRRSPSRRVTPARSRYSQSGTAYFRVVPSRSRISATVSPGPALSRSRIMRRISASVSLCR